MADIIKHDSMENATKAFAEGFSVAEKTKKYMAVVWGIADGKVEMIRRTTYDFPAGDFETCVKQLKESLDEEKKRMKPVEPKALPDGPSFLRYVKSGDNEGTIEKIAEASGIEKIEVPLTIFGETKELDSDKHSEAVLEKEKTLPISRSLDNKITETKETPKPCEE